MASARGYAVRQGKWDGVRKKCERAVLILKVLIVSGFYTFSAV